MSQKQVKPYKRKLRNFLIYPKFQLGLLGAQAAMLALAFVIVQIENHIRFSELTQMGVDTHLDQNSIRLSHFSQPS